ncbi:MAG: Fe-S cluster assembly protein SufD [Moraxellaceae bacterium]|nr:Fe-S cluster assembly protein SufD [Pseudobdellovibrionaceae bacterium]
MMTKEQFLEFKHKYPLYSARANSLRDNAYDHFVTDGFPTKKDEAWKYTSLTHLKESNFQFALDENGLSHEDMKWISNQLDSNSINFVFTNGYLNRTLSDDIEDLLKAQEMTVEDFQPIAETEQKVISWSRAFSNQKYVLEISKKNQTAKVIQFTFFQSNQAALFVNPTTEIKLGDDTSTQIIFNYLSRGNAGHFVNGHTTIHLGRGADLQFLQMQNEAALDTHVSRLIFNLSNQSRLTTLDLALGGILSRHYLQVNFNGEQAHAGVYGVIGLGGKQHSDHYTFINHIKGLNNSIQKYKSILADQSYSIFRGRVRIEKDAQKANSEQLNNSLMLSREANVSSIPQLEIYADDVKAGHGSTVGQLNKEEMFYFLSRGIDQITATKMLAYGFVMEMASVFENLNLKEKVSSVLNEKLNGMLK